MRVTKDNVGRVSVLVVAAYRGKPALDYCPHVPCHRCYQHRKEVQSPVPEPIRITRYRHQLRVIRIVASDEAESRLRTFYAVGNFR